MAERVTTVATLVLVLVLVATAVESTCFHTRVRRNQPSSLATSVMCPAAPTKSPVPPKTVKTPEAAEMLKNPEKVR